MSRKDPVINLDIRPEPGAMRRIMDVFHALFGKVVSLSVVTLLLNEAGYTVTNAAASAGTAITVTRTTIDFQDAGVDSVRVLARGKNSHVTNDITVQIYNVTTSAAMCTATITDNTEQTATGSWTVFAPNGDDEEVEVRVIGDGADDPILYAVHLQLRTVQARA